MAIKDNYQSKHELLLRDSRPLRVRIIEGAQEPTMAATVFIVSIVLMYSKGTSLLHFPLYSDLIFFAMLLYFWWLKKRPVTLPFKLPKSSRIVDPNYIKPNGQKGQADGILFLGNDATTNEEIWFTNNDARTHCLYLGTTGSGKTFGLKSFSCNALCWSSGYIYIDGKADTDLWSTLSAMARRFGRDDDLLIMNYMTGNIGGRVPSNTLNPFSSGSSSYLTNMLVSLMPDAGGDNAMWKERAISLVSAIMPCLVWKRDTQNIPLSIATVRQYLTFKAVIKLSRDSAIPQHLRTSIIAYLNELPGYVDDVFDDNGDEKPQSPDAAPADTSTPRQQHGYLSMQFTRSMSSLGDDYGFIFDTQAADIDMMDVVLNRRILVVLIPALEKSSDETANLGKIISSTLKGMMGATLGSTIEGDTAHAIENKPTTSSTPFMAIFDEVGYYTAQGMAVMAAQARSLGFSLIFSAQDLPALEKRVREEARSITANCNIKLFGKLEDPTQTKDFFEKTVGSAMVTEVSGFQRGPQAGGGANYMDSQNASIQVRSRASYDGLKGFTEGKAVCSFGKTLNDIMIYNSDVGHAKAMRVQRFLPVPPPSEEALESLHNVNAVLKRFRDPNWRANHPDTRPSADIDAMAEGFSDGRKAEYGFVESGILAVAAVADKHGTLKPEDTAQSDAAAPEAVLQTQPRVTAPETPSAQPAGARRPPPVTEAEAAAAAKILGGPLSWAEIIGGGEDASADDTPAQAPFLPATESQPQPAEQDGGLSWENALGLVPQPASPAAAPEAPPQENDNEADNGDAPPQADDMNGVSPLSWGDIIGGGDGSAEK